MNRWLLKVEVEGQWEECAYLSQAEAVAAFAAVVADYGLALSRAELVCGESVPPLPGLRTPERARPVYIN